MERLQKVLARAGIGSRRMCEDLIVAGRVEVNGEIVTVLGTKIDPLTDEVKVDGKPVDCADPGPRIYLMLNKPAGFLTTVRDPEGRPTVMDLLKDVPGRVYPVGRLDFDTEGLLLFTNDGNAAYGLMHPSNEIPKIYLAWVEGTPDASDLCRLSGGIRLLEGVTAPAKVEFVQGNEGKSLLRIEIHEGWKRQVRRMCEAIGHPVAHLKREGLGPFRLRGIKPGDYRYLEPDEVAWVRSIY